MDFWDQFSKWILKNGLALPLQLLLAPLVIDHRLETSVGVIKDCRLAIVAVVGDKVTVNTAVV